MSNSATNNEDTVVFWGVDKQWYNMEATTPIYANWDVSYGCNFRCVFCLSSSGVPDPAELTTEQGIALIDKLYAGGVVFLKILGGEPFFRKDILTLLKYAANKGMILSFSTNASLVTEDVAETLFQLRNSIIYIQMSLYGENEERYKKVTGSEENYAKALHGLKLLVDKGLDIAILVVATEENAGQIGEYYAIAKKFGVKEFRVTAKVNLGRAASEDEGNASVQPKIFRTLVRELEAIGKSVKDTDPVVRINSRPLLGNYLKKLTNIPYFWQNCRAASTMIHIDPMGKSVPCPFFLEMPEKLKEIYGQVELQDMVRDSFSDVWSSDVYNKFREYYDPDKNRFTINTKCRFYSDGSCIPCIVTPCNCPDMIQAIKREFRS